MAPPLQVGRGMRASAKRSPSCAGPFHDYGEVKGRRGRVRNKGCCRGPQEGFLLPELFVAANVFLFISIKYKEHGKIFALQHHGRKNTTVARAWQSCNQRGSCSLHQEENILPHHPLEEK